jgi:hypothetical protein
MSYYTLRVNEAADELATVDASYVDWEKKEEASG